MLKIVLLILVVVGVLWLVRIGRRGAGSAQSRNEPPRHELIVSCAHCGLHLPHSDALPGRGGVFCDETHRSAYEKVHPPS